MSDEITPEWLRVKREMEALWGGFYDELGKLEDRVSTLERGQRIDRASINDMRRSIERLRKLVDEENGIFSEFNAPGFN